MVAESSTRNIVLDMLCFPEGDFQMASPLRDVSWSVRSAGSG
jgi:hypothetical protein